MLARLPSSPVWKADDGAKLQEAVIVGLKGLPAQTFARLLTRSCPCPKSGHHTTITPKVSCYITMRRNLNPPLHVAQTWDSARLPPFARQASRIDWTEKTMGVPHPSPAAWKTRTAASFLGRRAGRPTAESRRPLGDVRGLEETWFRVCLSRALRLGRLGGEGGPQARMLL